MARPNWADDPSIPDEAILWRGIVSRQIRPNPRTQTDGVSQGAFETQELSVNVAAETTAAAVLAKGKRRGVEWRLWEFTAGQARSLGLIVDRDPESDDPSHAVIVRADAPGLRLRGSQAKQLAEIGRWASVSISPGPSSTVSVG